MYAQNVVKGALCVSVLLLSCAAQAQKLSDLLVTKDAKPGLWVSKPMQMPKGLEALMKLDSACATKEQLLERLNQSIQLVSSGNKVENSCPTEILSNTASEATMQTKCSKEIFGTDFEIKNSIKRTASDTWVFTVNSKNSVGTLQTMQTAMKYIGECRVK